MYVDFHLQQIDTTDKHFDYLLDNTDTNSLSYTCTDDGRTALRKRSNELDDNDKEKQFRTFAA